MFHYESHMTKSELGVKSNCQFFIKCLGLINMQMFKSFTIVKHDIYDYMSKPKLSKLTYATWARLVIPFKLGNLKARPHTLDNLTYLFQVA